MWIHIENVKITTIRTIQDKKKNNIGLFNNQLLNIKFASIIKYPAKISELSWENLIEKAQKFCPKVGLKIVLQITPIQIFGVKKNK